MSGGQSLVDIDDEDQRFFIVQRKDSDCISRVGSVSVLMWYATRLMDNPTLEAEQVGIAIAEAIAGTLLLGPESAETWIGCLIVNLGTMVEIAAFESYLEFKDHWTEKVDQFFERTVLYTRA